MIIFNTPFKFTHIYKTIADFIRIIFINNKFEIKQPKLHFVYFSYKPDFKYLLMSLQTLIENFDDSLLGSINIFEDQKSPFDSHQTFQLTDISPRVKIHKVQNFSWSSKDSTYEEIKCFNVVNKEMKESDMLVKTDSDILFFSSYKMIKVLNSDIHAAGDGHYENYSFAQGGLYMIRSSLITDILQPIDMNYIEYIVNLNNNTAEDRAISKILELAGKPFFLTRLMLFPNEYRKLSFLSKFNKKDLCAAHFIKDKDVMEQFRHLFRKK